MYPISKRCLPSTFSGPGEWLTYLKERNCLEDKFSRIFAQFAKLNPRQFFFFYCITYIFTSDSISINDGHVKNILQGIKQYKQRQHRKKNVNLFLILLLLISS